MTTLVGGDPSEMAAKRRAMAETRSALQAFGSKAGGVAIPAHPAGLRGQIRGALDRTNATSQSAQRELTRLEGDLRRRAALLAIADAIGALSSVLAAPRLGSGDLTPDGLIPAPKGVDDDVFGSIIGGFGEAIARYGKQFHVTSSTVTTIEREIRRSVTIQIRNGKAIVTELTSEIERIRTSTTVTRTAVRFARAARAAGRVFSIVGHVDNAVSVVRAFGVKGKERWSAIGGAVGKWGLGAGAASVGATWGASAGTALIPIPIVGTVVGAGVGAAVGGLVGSKVGKAVGAAVGEAARQGKEALESAGKKASDAASKAADHAKEAFGDAADTLGGAKRALGGLF